MDDLTFSVCMETLQPRQLTSSCRSKAWLWGVLAVAICGCGDGRPRNPALEVIENPPVEVSEIFRNASIRLNGDLVGVNDISLSAGQSISIHAEFEQDADSPIGPSSSSMLHVRFNPPGTSESGWKAWEFLDEFAGPVQANGTGQFNAILKAVPGVYDIRCYILIGVPSKEVPEFHLIKKGTATVLP